MCLRRSFTIYELDILYSSIPSDSLSQTIYVFLLIDHLILGLFHNATRLERAVTAQSVLRWATGF